MRLLLLLAASILVIVSNAAPQTLPCNGPDLSGLIGTIFHTTVESSPNPIATLYPGNVTGTINGTLAVVPIPYAEARSIIPSQYGILVNQYESILPGFPAGFYPLIIRAILDHDIIFEGLNLVPDFQSIHVFYPFVDLLGDGYSGFAYEKVILMTATNLIAQEGAAAYGESVYPSTFIPPNNAYAFTKKGEECGEIFLNAYTNLSSCPAVATRFQSQSAIGPWPYDFYVNVTNQPVFANASLRCDQQISLYNSSVSTGKNAAVGVTGDIFIATPYLPVDSFFPGVHGLKVDIAFIENNMLECSSLKGI